MKTLQLSEDSAIVLQQIEENVPEDFDSLAENLLYDHKTLAHILKNLQNKGLIITKGSWIYLSSKGKKTTELIWPKLDYIRY